MVAKPAVAYYPAACGRTDLYTPREASSTGVALSILTASVDPREETAWPRSLAPEAMKALEGWVL